MGAAGVTRLRGLADEDDPLSADDLLEGGQALYSDLPEHRWFCVPFVRCPDSLAEVYCPAKVYCSEGCFVLTARCIS